jgi:hypothetical protein
MIQILLITREVEWNRKLEFEEERWKSDRFQPIVNYLAPPQSTRKERKHQASRVTVNFIPALTGLPFAQSCE